MEVLLIRGGLTYRVVEGDPDIDALVEHLVNDKAECIGKLRMLSRQQVTARLGRADKTSTKLPLPYRCVLMCAAPLRFHLR